MSGFNIYIGVGLINLSSTRYISVISLLVLHFDGNATFVWFDLIINLIFLVTAENPDKNGHEEEEDSGCNHGISNIAKEICQVIDEWSQASLRWWTSLNRIGKVEHRWGA